MSVLILIVSFFVALFCSLFFTRQIIRYFKRNNIIAIDVQKKDKPRVANSGGVPVFFAMSLGVMVYVAVQTFTGSGTSQQTVFLFASLLTIFFITIVGFFDDLNNREVVEGKAEIRSGLRQWQKPLLTLPAAIPLMVVKAGYTTMVLPFLGSVDFGLFYPLLLVPLGVTFAANAVNLLGGFNGSEAGMGIVYFGALGIFALMHQQLAAAVLFFSMAGALLGFLRYNWPPARILSGDSIQYAMGATVAAGAIIGNMERAGVFMMLIFIIEFFFKLRARLRAHCMGKLRPDGKLDPPYGKKIYSWAHIVMNIRPMTEVQVTLMLILLQIILSIFLFVIF